MSIQDPNAKQPADKGKLLGKCNRTACWNRPASWYSRVMDAFYCFKCAHDINRCSPPGVDKIYEFVCVVDEDVDTYVGPMEYDSLGEPVRRPR